MSVVVRRGELLRPAAGDDPAPFDANRLDRVDPGELAGALHRGRDQHAPVEAGTARAEALETVDWRQFGMGVVEGEQLPLHGAPGALCGTFGDRSGGLAPPDRTRRASIWSCRLMVQWSHFRCSLPTLYIEPGSSLKNGYIKSFNGKLRDELLHGEIFDTLWGSSGADAKLAQDLQRGTTAQLPGLSASGTGGLPALGRRLGVHLRGLDSI